MRYEVLDREGKIVWDGDAIDRNHALRRAYCVMPMDLQDLIRAAGFTVREASERVTVDAAAVRTVLQMIHRIRDIGFDDVMAAGPSINKLYEALSTQSQETEKKE